jgi:hypothetical protein
MVDGMLAASLERIEWWVDDVVFVHLQGLLTAGDVESILLLGRFHYNAT